VQLDELAYFTRISWGIPTSEQTHSMMPIRRQ
jgi:hypothetical protein